MNIHNINMSLNTILFICAVVVWKTEYWSLIIDHIAPLEDIEHVLLINAN